MRISKTARHRRLAVAALPLLLVAGACRPAGDASAAAARAGSKPLPPVSVLTLEEEKLPTSVSLPGELVAFERVDLYAKTSSFVRRVLVDVGSRVTQGQLLATLEAPELLSQIAEAESKLQAQDAVYVAAKAKYDRLVETSKTPGTVSPSDLEQADATVKSELAKLEAARAARQAITSMRAYLDVRAPFDGVVTARNVSAGAYVGPAGRGSEAPLFVIQQQDRLRLVVSVPEERTTDLSIGEEVSFVVRSDSTERFTAKVSRLAGALDTHLRAERVEMDVDNRAGHLLPGSVANVTLRLAARGGRFVVPRSAVVDSTTGTFVIRVVDRKAKWTPVDAGHEANGKVEIAGDVHPGDLLVVKANEELRDGARIERVAPALP